MQRSIRGPMQLALKHFDLVIGVDVHVVVPPPPAVPVPMPTPFTGFLFDAFDYLPGGATVRIGGLPRAHAGTSAIAMPPHIPIGGLFLKPPANEGELFMGSSTVIVDGEPMGQASSPVLTCQDIGVPAPLRMKKKARAALYLPTSMTVPIPSTMVFVGGAPTVSMTQLQGAVMGAAFKRMRALLQKSKACRGIDRKLKGASEYLNALADRVFEKARLSLAGSLRNRVRREICTWTGHPVDVATGKVCTEFVDLTLPGPLPFEIERVWFSTSTYEGPLGRGWHASFDMALAVDEEVIALRTEDGRAVLFPSLPNVGDSHFESRERMTLVRERDGYRLLRDGRTYRFDGAGDVLPLAALEDRNGFVLQFRRDERGRLQSIEDAGGRSWSFRYDGALLASIEGPHPDREGERVVYQRYAYDLSGQLVEATDALGHAQRFAYERGLLVRETLKSGVSFHFEYDQQERCTRTWGDGDLYHHKLTYDALFSRTTVEDSLGHKTQYEHDGAVVLRQIDALGNERYTEYDDDYRVLVETDELGQRTTHRYDARGNRVETVLPDGATTLVEYLDDVPVRAVDSLGGEWKWERDARGREVACTDPLGNVTRRAYEGAYLVAVTDALGARTRLHYGRRGELTVCATAEGAVTRYAYDFAGRLTAITDPLGNVQRRALDPLGRATRVEEPDGNVRTFEHDAEGNVVRAKDVHHDVRFSYRGMGKLVSRSEAGTTVQFRYNTEEQLTAVINEHGCAYRFVLGPSGLVDEEHGFDGLARKYIRDRAGRVMRVERPGERFSAYSYDAAGRVLGVEHHDGSAEQYAYRADGALMSAANDDATLTFERDPLGRVVREAHREGWVESEYDACGRRVRMRSSFGIDERIARNEVGDVLGIEEVQSGFHARFERDLLGHELTSTLPGGVRSRWRRDQAGRPVEHIIEHEGRALRAVGYRWEANDRLRSVIDGMRGPTRYHHDPRGNLARADYPDGSADLRLPDAVGNLFRDETRTDREYGHAGELIVARSDRGDTHYAYDAEGNLIIKTEPDGARWHYTWNAAGMLSAVQRPDGSTVTFAYDALGRRLRKTYRCQTTHWLWDGNVPLHEWVEGKPQTLTEAGGVPWATADESRREREAELERMIARPAPERGTRRQPLTWLFDPESFVPLALLHTGGAQSMVCDHLGTPVLMVDGDGQRLWSAEIDTYGAPRHLEGERWSCPFRWPGQYEDAETGLYYNRFRYYDPDAGLYVSSDPIGLLGGPALRASVADPLVWFDPLGLASCKLDREGFVNPDEINFSQDSVKRLFRDGTDINDAIRALRRDGARGAAQYPPIRILEREGRLYTLDNRRLLVFTQAQQPVPYRMATPQEIRREFDRKFTTNQARGWGRYISVRS